MIFYFDAFGYPIKSVPEKVFQGSNKANRIYFAMPIKSNSTVTASFLLPTGEVLSEQQMTAQGAITGLKVGGVSLNQWYIDITTAISAFPGQCTVQFKATSDGDEVIATAAAEFTVSKGVPIRLPDLSALDKDTYEKLVTTITSLQNAFVDTDSSAGFVFTNVKSSSVLTSACVDYIGTVDQNVLKVAPFSLDEEGNYYKVIKYGNGKEAVVDTVSVRLPDTIEEITAYAFKGVAGKSRPIEIPASVMTVGAYAFDITANADGQYMSFESFPNDLHSKAFGDDNAEKGQIIVYCPPAYLERWKAYKSLWYKTARLIIKSDDLTDYYTKEETKAQIALQIKERAYIKEFTKDDFVKVGDLKLYYVQTMPQEHHLTNPYVDTVLANSIDGEEVVAQNIVSGDKVLKGGIVKVYFTIDIDRYEDYSGKIYLKEM